MARSRRRLWPLLVVVLVVGVVLLFARHRAVEVEAEYVLVDARRGELEALHVRWSGADGGKVVEASFRYDPADGSGRGAPRYQTQTLELPPDTYTVQLRLERADGTSEVIEREIVVEQAATIEVRP